jgi:prolyl 4-hydroxylase
MVKSISCKSNKIILIFLTAVAVITNVQKWNTITWESSHFRPALLVEAFAANGGGGFGGGGFGASPKTNNKKKTNKRNKRQENIAGMMETIPTKNKKKESLETSLTSAKTKQPKLDKWGLPVATLEDIFPPLPASTELNPVDASKEHYTLSEIQECVKDHADLGDLNRIFDDQGLAKIPNQDGSTMRLRLLHRSPPVLTLDNFLTADECQNVREVAERKTSSHRVGSATFQGALSTRTSTSWFCHYIDLPVLIAKAHHILGVPLETMEEPQIVRYKGGEEFSWHYDEVPKPQLSNGGQRLATLLVYLADTPSGRGGGTTFRDLKESSTSSSSLVMQPQKGSALLFFPSFADGSPDDRTLHKSEVLKGDDNEDDHKWIVQMWTHQRDYKAALPVGNSYEAAREIMKETGAKLGYD